MEEELRFIKKSVSIVKSDNLEKEESVEKKENVKNKIDQDTLIEKFQKECKKKNLEKGKTVPTKELYEMAKNIGITKGELDTFEPGDKAYHIAREFASRLGYKRKKPAER